MFKTLPPTRKRGRPALVRNKRAPKPALVKIAPEANSLGSRIKLCRKQIGMSQGQLAQPEYVASYISAIERDKIRPSLKALQLLAGRLNKPVEFLLYGGDSPVPGGSPGQALAATLSRGRLLLEAAELDDSRSSHWNEIIDIVDNMPAFELTEYDRVTLFLIQGRLKQRRGENEESAADYLAGLELARKTGQIEAQVELKNRLGNLALAQSQYEQAVDRYREALAICEENRELVPASLWAEVLNRLSKGLLAKGDSREALACYTELGEWQEKAGSLTASAAEYSQLSAAYRNRQDLRTAVRYEFAALNCLEEVKRQRLEVECQAGIGEGLILAGNFMEGKVLLEEAHRTILAGVAVGKIGEAQIYENLARLRLSEGQVEEACRLAGLSLEIAQVSGSRQRQATAQLVLAEVEEALGQLENAEGSFKIALDWLEEEGRAEPLAEAYKAYSRLLEKRGELELALQYLKKAVLLKG